MKATNATAFDSAQQALSLRITPEDKARGNLEDDQFAQFCARITQRLNTIERAGQPVLRTSVDGKALWAEYLNGFDDPYQRQLANCWADESFIRHYGSLAVIDAEGNVVPALWDETEQFYKGSVTNMVRLIRKSKIVGIYVPHQQVWGTPVANDIWQNLHATLEQVPHITAADASKLEGEARENFNMVRRTMQVLSVSELTAFKTMLQSGAFTSPEKFLPMIDWWLQLLRLRNNSNLVWNAIAIAPPAWSHLKNTTAGECLELIRTGVSTDAIIRFYNKAMDPLKYQRPQAPPTEGAIAVAEKRVQILGIEASLNRRAALLSEIPELLWSPKAPQGVPSGVFAHLSKAKGPAHTLNGGKITMVKFMSQVLPNADSLVVPLTSAMNFAAFVTAVDHSAPPIFQWDNPEFRNPFSTYVYPNGSSPALWNLRGKSEAKVLAAVRKPFEWFGGGYEHHGHGVCFILEDCEDTNRDGGSALFPELLKAELREVRSVIEAHSNATPMGRVAGQHASGVLITTDSRGCNIRVITGNVATEYTIDRWE